VSDDPFDGLALTDDQVRERRAVVPRKIAKRRERFIMVPMAWRERLTGATGNTILVALDLLYLAWKGGKGGPVKLANGMLKHERRGLITVERSPQPLAARSSVAFLRQISVGILAAGFLFICRVLAADGV